MSASAFMTFVHLVADGDVDNVARRLAGAPELATKAAGEGATRQSSAPYFFENIAHCLYAGDTALHVAAAALQPKIAALLISRGADCRARNRRGAEPLHYAADANHWNPDAQAETITFLISAGADPRLPNGRGSTPMQLAQRTTGRGGSGSPQAEIVKLLAEHGAGRRRNG